MVLKVACVALPVPEFLVPPDFLSRAPPLLPLLVALGFSSSSAGDPEAGGCLLPLGAAGVLSSEFRTNSPMQADPLSELKSPA